MNWQRGLFSITFLLFIDDLLRFLIKFNILFSMIKLLLTFLNGFELTMFKIQRLLVQLIYDLATFLATASTFFTKPLQSLSVKWCLRRTYTFFLIWDILNLSIVGWVDKDTVRHWGYLRHQRALRRAILELIEVISWNICHDTCCSCFVDIFHIAWWGVGCHNWSAIFPSQLFHFFLCLSISGSVRRLSGVCNDFRHRSWFFQSRL